MSTPPAHNIHTHFHMTPGGCFTDNSLLGLCCVSCVRYLVSLHRLSDLIRMERIKVRQQKFKRGKEKMLSMAQESGEGQMLVQPEEDDDDGMTEPTRASYCAVHMKTVYVGLNVVASRSRGRWVRVCFVLVNINMQPCCEIMSISLVFELKKSSFIEQKYGFEVCFS